MEDIIQHGHQFYIKASSTLADQRLRVLKQGQAFGVFDVYGDVKPIGSGAQGFFNGATRFLSRMELRLGNRYPILLSSSITSDDHLLVADLTNADIALGEGVTIPHSSFHVSRSKFVLEDSCYEQIEITNFSEREIILPISIIYRADFADMFEIRGMRREKHGEPLKTLVAEDYVVLSHRGVDQKIRSARLHFSPAPVQISEAECRYELKLAPDEKATVYTTVTCWHREYQEAPFRTFPDEYARAFDFHLQKAKDKCIINASSERFNLWLERSRSDIALMTTKSEYGTYPYAGIPWFNTIFGRDGLITAMQCLWTDANLAKGVLMCLAKLQAHEDRPYEDAEPGKMLHELRDGEMVSTGELPFKKYYGSADVTPLFVILAGRYLKTTADTEFIQNIWPSIEKAVAWIDGYGDIDHDGFVEYFKRSPKGLDNQGWKDSPDSVSHHDGRLAEGPIALCEVQGYVYEAKLQAAMIAKHLGKLSQSQQYEREALALQQKFQTSFWDFEKDFVALALDGKKNPCHVLSSNAGHCLFSKIVTKEQAQKVATHLFSEEMFSGWGVRTLSSKAARYNPMSYHNGSVWPHDNAIIAEGLANYGLKDEVLKVTEAMFDLAAHIDLYRLPELFCGFPKRPGQAPTLYPVACSPQAWAAGSVFQLLKACLGLEIDGLQKRVLFNHPVLPSAIQDLQINKLAVGSDGEVDILLRRRGTEISVYVDRRVGPIEVIVVK
jgi:glycogen debranching enzyme